MSPAMAAQAEVGIKPCDQPGARAQSGGMSNGGGGEEDGAALGGGPPARQLKKPWHSELRSGRGAAGSLSRPTDDPKMS